VTPVVTRRHCQQRYEALRSASALPRLSAIVGAATADQFSCDQGVVLLNGWNYRPRPVFQGYSAYTARLLADNATFFRSDRAPRFILWHLDPLDKRFPASEDGPALLEIVRRYHPVAEEDDYLLLERRSLQPTDAVTSPIVWRRDVPFDEEVQTGALPGATQLVHFHMDESLRGTLTRLLFRPPEVFLRVRTADGQTLRYRLIPALASSTFLLNPLVRDDRDLVRWYRGDEVPRVVAFTVEGSSTARSCYRGNIHVVIERDDSLNGP
jgi:hypothetical protein